MKILAADATLSPELQDRMRRFCDGVPIEKLELFGSCARGTMREESDIDLLATFRSDVPRGFAYFGFVQKLQSELTGLLGCRVDLLDRASVENSRNPIRRAEILEQARVIYERRA